MKTLTVATLVCALGLSAASAQSFKISLAVRETGGSGPAFSNAGTAGGIEWINRDGQTLVADGTWQLFTFTPEVDTLLAFAGTTANSVLDTDWGALEHIRILNSSGVSQPIRLWIDDIKNTDSTGSFTEGFETFAVGSEVIFQEPSFSGSTVGNVLGDPNSSLVTDTMAFSGTQSDEINLQFVDNDPTRWVRLTSFGTANLLNPALHLRESNFDPTISFYAKAIIVPEPSTAAFLGLGLLALIARFRRQ